MRMLMAIAMVLYLSFALQQLQNTNPLEFYERLTLQAYFPLKRGNTRL